MKLVPISPINTAILATMPGADTFGDEVIEGRRQRRKRRQRRRQRRGGSQKPRKPRGNRHRQPTAARPSQQRPARRPLRSMPRQQPAEEPEYEELPVEDDFEDFEDFDEELEAELEAELGRLPIPKGALRSAFRRARDRVRRGRGRQTPRRLIQRGRDEDEAAAPTAPPSPPSADAWGPVSRLGHNIRIQAGNGHRAAILPLRPGLWIVADVAEQSVLPTTEGGFGLAPILPGLMLRAVRNAVQNGQERRSNRRAERRSVPYQTTAVVPSSPLTLAGMAGCTWCSAEELA